MALIHELIGKIMSEVGAIGKDQKNAQQGFMFRGIDQVYNTLQPILAKYGVFSVPEVLSETHEERTSKNGGILIYRIYKVKYTFYAPDGSSIESVVIGEGMDSGDKAGNKALAIAHKYVYFQVFSIPIKENDDPDRESHEVLPKVIKPSPVFQTQKKTLRDKMIEKGLSELEQKTFYDWVCPVNSKEAADFIERFDHMYTEWQADQKPKDDIPY
jgi:hypothetical protein